MNEQPSNQRLLPGDWVWSDAHQQAGRIVETQTLWGSTVCRVWLPDVEVVARVSAQHLRPLSDRDALSGDAVSYLAAAARINESLAQDALLAPLASTVIPLPHQLRALERVMASDQIRFLLADEVGLGKTIEAGLIMRELKLRGLVARTLVVAPKGLTPQWVAEMRTHFGEDFRLLTPTGLAASRTWSDGVNPWSAYQQVIVPIDSVKPLEGRRGWSREQVAAYNRERFEELITAGWDLVIVDEAHRLAGSTDQVARYKLGQGLAGAAPYLLLLSATPHQGKTDAFQRLLALLDSDAFPDIFSVTRARVQPYVIRTEKRRAIDGAGTPLFLPRHTRMVAVAWEERHREQQLLYDAVTDYVREGYNQALREKRSAMGFLMVLLQRLVVSSTQAIRATLERRLEALELPEEETALLPSVAEEDWAELDGQEQVDALLSSRVVSLKNERAEVRTLINAARRCEAAGLDAKAEALLVQLYRLQQEESDPNLKALIFTEFVPTQEMLRRFLSDRGFPVVCLNGRMDMEERARVQREFADDARIMISTEAGGEGLNLQFCHIVINYDIPWNPMRLEQRIGRVDRIGQRHEVHAVNLFLDQSVEHRVREVLEQKLAVILQELGIDKAGDVLDSSEAAPWFDDLYMQAILHPESVETSVNDVVARIHAEAQETRQRTDILGASEEVDAAGAQRLLAHPLPHWVERMAVSYLRSHGGTAVNHGDAWDLVRPDGTAVPGVVFSGRDAERHPGARQLTLEDAWVRDLVEHIPCVVEGQPFPIVQFAALPAEVRGTWSLWMIALHDGSTTQQRVLPLFFHDDGRQLLPTARRIWDELLSTPPIMRGLVSGNDATAILARIQAAALAQAQPIYLSLIERQGQRRIREQEKAEYAFAARRRALERIGLPAVRERRLAILGYEEQAWRERWADTPPPLPEMTPLLLVRAEGGVGDA